MPAMRLRTLVLLYAVLVAAAPSTLLVLQGEEAHDQRVARIEQEALEDARETARIQRQAVRDITNSLDLLSEVPAVQEGGSGACHDVLESVAATRVDLEVMWRIDATGHVLCASRDARADLSHWPPVQAFHADPLRAVAPYGLDPRTGEPVLPLAARMPGRPDELLVAAVNFERLQERMAALAQTANETIHLVDAAGREVVFSGGPPADQDLLRRIQEDPGPWRAVQGGIERLYVSVPLDPDGRSLEGRVVVGIPTGPLDAAARADRIERGLLLLGVLVVAGVAAAVMAHRSFERPVALLVRSVRRFEAGDLRASVPDDLPAELGELGEALEGMATSIQRMEHTRQALLNHLAHQVRTPLTPLVLQTSLARRAAEKGDGAALDRALAAMERPLEDLRRKADKLDVVGDLVLGARSAEREPTAARALLEEARGRIPAEIEADDLRVVADPPLVVLAVAELLQNAVAARPDGPIVLRARRQAGDVLLSVHDPGHALAPEEIERLLTPRWTWDAPGDRSGLGLGVLIASLVAQAHGGRLEGGVGAQGTWFGLRLPADGPQEAPRP